MKYVSGCTFINHIDEMDSEYYVLLNKSFFENIFILFKMLIKLRLQKVKLINKSIFNNKLEELSLISFLLNCNDNDVFYDLDGELKINIPSLKIKNFIGD